MVRTRDTCQGVKMNVAYRHRPLTALHPFGSTMNTLPTLASASFKNACLSGLLNRKPCFHPPLLAFGVVRHVPVAHGRQSTGGVFAGVSMRVRAVRYSAIALIAHLYGRHVIRVLRHPTQYWGWLLLFGGLFVALIITAVVLNRRVAEASS